MDTSRKGFRFNWEVVQLVEQRPLTAYVEGSSPSLPAMKVLIYSVTFSEIKERCLECKYLW